VDLPLVGDKLGQAATFIRDIRLGLLADLRERLSGPGAAIEFIRDGIWDVFGPSGLNIIRDADGNGLIEIDDIHVGWYDEAGNLLKEWKPGDALPMEGNVYDAEGNLVEDWEEGDPIPAGGFQLDADTDAIQWEIPLGGMAFGTGVDIPLDIDLPGFGLQVDGGFAVGLTWGLDFGLGLSLEDGFFLTTNDKTSPEDPELEVEIGAYLDGKPLDNAVVTPFVASGKLLFFKVTAADTDRESGTPGFQPSGLFGFLEIDMIGDE
jgi:hypothetical protein